MLRSLGDLARAEKLHLFTRAVPVAGLDASTLREALGSHPNPNPNPNPNEALGSHPDPNPNPYPNPNPNEALGSHRAVQSGATFRERSVLVFGDEASPP